MIFRKHVQCFAIVLLAFLHTMALPLLAAEDSNSPWGNSTKSNDGYTPHKVVYDVGTTSLDEFSFVLDRASFLKNLYEANPFDASIILVLHGAEVPFFAIENYAEYKDLMQRAHSLSLDGIIEFRMCEQAANAFGYKPDEMHGFVKMALMADAEIIRLQHEESYVYMR